MTMRNLNTLLLLVSYSMCAIADNGAFGPQHSFKGMFNLNKIRKNINILDVVQGARKNRILGRFEATDTNLDDLKGHNEPQGRMKFHLKVSQPVLLMKSKGLVAEACRASFYNHTIQSRGCISKTIQLKHCSGRCSSFYVPMESGVFRFCSHCLPKKSQIAGIILVCPGRNSGFKIKPMRIIESCACQSVKSCSS